MKYSVLKMTFLLFLLVVFFLGMVVYVKQSSKEPMENNSDDTTSSCPDMLVNAGDKLLLYNSKTPNVQPITFSTLDEYIEYTKGFGNDCPILYLQQETNAQGQDVYRMRPGPFNQEGGLPTVSETEVIARATPLQIADASRDNGNYNQGNYPGFDPYGLYVGRVTDIDKVHISTEVGASLSDNPMDSNWGGVEYTENAVRSGKYDENNVTVPSLITPRNGAYPGLVPTGIAPPVDKM
jgi:hypothetical protein